MSVICRPAAAEDAGAIAALEREVFPDAWKEDDIGGLIADRLSVALIAEENGEAVGYLLGRLIPPEGEVYRVAVLPAFRRRGIGQALLSATVTADIPRGMERLFLEVRAKNAPARALYSAFGFTEDGIRKNYYRQPTDDALLMTYLIS